VQNPGHGGLESHGISEIARRGGGRIGILDDAMSDHRQAVIGQKPQALRLVEDHALGEARCQRVRRPRAWKAAL
jgi:hypothetical protein